MAHDIQLLGPLRQLGYALNRCRSSTDVRNPLVLQLREIGLFWIPSSVRIVPSGRLMPPVRQLRPYLLDALSIETYMERMGFKHIEAFDLRQFRIREQLACVSGHSY